MTPLPSDPDLAEVLDELGVTPSDLVERYRHLRALVHDAVDEVVDRGREAIPVLDGDALHRLVDDEDVRGRVRRAGCVVIRGTFDREEAVTWDREIGDYLDRNRFDEAFAARYPDAAAGSRIWGIYWSRPQVLARQHERMAATRSALNSLWHHDAADPANWFDPDRDIAYPDRIRRRAPGAEARGLAPHTDAPIRGGWRTTENRAVYRAAIDGEPDRYDPFDATCRTPVDPESPVATVFRTFQGWTALSETRPSDGGLSIAPIPLVAPYLLLAGMVRDLDPDTAAPPPARVHDPLVAPALVPIPTVHPGDTVWWHGDLVHAVGAAANEVRWSNVMYIGSAPGCPRNDGYAAGAVERFVTGRSPVDFPAEDFECEFTGRATLDDLDDRGRAQFGLAARGDAGAPS